MMLERDRAYLVLVLPRLGLRATPTLVRQPLEACCACLPCLVRTWLGVVGLDRSVTWRGTTSMMACSDMVLSIAAAVLLDWVSLVMCDTSTSSVSVIDELKNRKKISTMKVFRFTI